MTYEEMIDIIESKITFPFSLSWKARKDFMYFYKKYSIEFIGECIAIGARQYLRYDADGLATQESVNVFLNKIGGILHNKTRLPIQQSINYIQAIGRKRHEDWNRYTAQALLNEYIGVLAYNNWNEDMIAEELRGNIVGITKEAKDWIEWQEKISNIIATEGGDVPPRAAEISPAGEPN